MKHTLLAEALTPSTANMHDFFKCLGIHAYVSKMAGNDGTQWDKI